MKNLFLLLTTILFTGCFNYIPHKVYKDQQAYSFDTMISLNWDGNYPVRIWEEEIKLGKPIKAWNGFTYIIEPHPTREGYVVIRTDITELR